MRKVECGRRSETRLLVSLYALVIALFLMSCTVAPKMPVELEPSFDAGLQNSGILGRLTNHGDYIITTHARDRYIALAAQFGHLLRPPVTNDFGIVLYTNGTFRADAQRIVQFGVLNWAAKSQPPALAPPPLPPGTHP